MDNGIVSVRLSTELNQRLTALAGRSGKTKSYYIQQLLSEHIDDLEDACLAFERIEKSRGNGETLLTLEEVKKALDLDPQI